MRTDGPAWEAAWATQTRPQLKAAHAVSRAVASGANGRVALLRLAKVCATEPARPRGEDTAAGHALHGAIAEAVAAVHMDQDRPRARLAAALWAEYVRDGRTIAEIARAAPHRDARTVGRVRYLMGLTHVGDGHGEPSLLAQLTVAVATATGRALLDPAAAAEAVAASAWTTMAANPAARSLLKVLSVVAPDPLPLDVLDAPYQRGLLPLAMRRRMKEGQPRPAREAAATLVQLGVCRRVDVGEPAVVLDESARRFVQSRFASGERERLESMLIRLLDSGLPASPTSVAEVGAWRPLLEHAVALAEAVSCRSLDSRLLQVAGQMFNDAGMYLRNDTNDRSRSVLLLQRSLETMNAAKRPDLEAYNAALVNAATVSRDPTVELAFVSEALASREGTLARDDGALLGTRLAHANSLANNGRFDDARRVHDELATDVRGIYIEALHDHATFLANAAAHQHGRPGDEDRALTLLAEVMRVTRPGDHGYWQSRLNWADMLVRAGRAAGAEHEIRALLGYAIENYGDNHVTLLVYDTLLSITDVTGASDRDALDEQARRLDRILMGQEPDSD